MDDLIIALHNVGLLCQWHQVLLRVSYSFSKNSLCNSLTHSSASSCFTAKLIFIFEEPADIISMFIPFLPKTENVRPAMLGSMFIPCPTIDTVALELNTSSSAISFKSFLSSSISYLSSVVKETLTSDVDVRSTDILCLLNISNILYK